MTIWTGVASRANTLQKSSNQSLPCGPTMDNAGDYMFMACVYKICIVLMLCLQVFREGKFGNHLFKPCKQKF